MDTEVQEGGGHMYIYGWLILIFGRNQCNSVFIFQFKNFFKYFFKWAQGIPRFITFRTFIYLFI